MKTSSLVLLVLIATAAAVPGQIVATNEASVSYMIGQAGPHSREWLKVVRTTNALGGGIISRTNRAYQEVATGLNHLKGGQWVGSSEKIEILPGGGAGATNGQHQVFFPSDIYEGEIELVTPDGKHLRTRPWGLSYFDGSNSVLIAELTNSIGQILPSGNQVVYPKAFGDFADLRCSYTLAGYEQDVVWRARPPAPEEYELVASGARLQVLTEFLSPPEPILSSRTLPAQAGVALPDDRLDFGMMEIGPGRAFMLGEEAQPGRVIIGKQWTVLEGRQFLIEEAPVAALTNEFLLLPEAGTHASLRTPLRKASRKLTLPAPRMAKNTGSKRMQTASLSTAPGLVWDYSTINTSQTNHTFQSDTTYFIRNSVILYGTTTIEGGTVIKVTNTTSASISIGGPVKCLTEAYRPAIFTSQFDNSVGESVASGTPTNYGGSALYFQALGQQVELSNLRIAYAKVGVEVGTDQGDTVTLRNVQLLKCGTAVRLGGYPDYPEVNIYNGLIQGATNAFAVWHGGSVTAQNLTVDDCDTLALVEDGEPGFYVRNSILANVTDNGGGEALDGDHNGFHNSETFGTTTFSSGTNPFQTAGGGNYYLANGCGFRNGGTNDIDATLLSDLRQKTTYPPIVYGPQVLSGDLILSPQAQRDTDIPDLGYHYDPLDFAFSGVYVTNTTITVNPGTAIATFGTNGWTYGIGLAENSRFLSQGSATSPNRIVVFNTVQEQANSGWSTPTYASITEAFSGAPAAINCRFTDWSVLATDAPHFYGQNNTVINFQDCQFHGGQMISYNPTINFTNCLLERVYAELDFEDSEVPHFRNNLIWGGSFGLFTYATDAVIKDNLFDQAAIPDWGLTSYDGGYNAYVTNYDRLQPTKSSDVILSSSPAYQTGALGRYYYPTNLSQLLNAGSESNAGLVGLYHFTTQTNQVKETNSVVDIGFHYVAVDAIGSPIDQDGDGFPDYYEDIDGDGEADTGETDWLVSEHGTTGVPGLIVFTPLH